MEPARTSPTPSLPIINVGSSRLSISQKEEEDDMDDSEQLSSPASHLVGYPRRLAENSAIVRRVSSQITNDEKMLDVHSLRPNYQRLVVKGVASSDPEEFEMAYMILKCLDVRRRFLFIPFRPFKSDQPPGPTAPFNPFTEKIPGPSPFAYDRNEDGVLCFYATDDATKKTMFDVPSLRDYYKALNDILNFTSLGPCKTISFKRLKFLEAKYNMHVLLNESEELAVQKLVPHRDFYNVRKVDVHVHHSSAMNQKHLLNFIRNKLRTEGNETVLFRDNQYFTLTQVFESLRLSPYDLSVDTLDVHADTKTFHRFDRFNTKYNPFGQSRLREVFLKTDNHIKGRYLAEITKELFKNLEDSKYQNTEYRLSIYGKNQQEWGKLAKWVISNKLYSDNNRWLIQIPRMYNVYKESFADFTFQEFLDNIFKPLFDVTINPQSNPDLHLFLLQVVGFDCVDDESKPEKRLPRYPPPHEWTSVFNPPYSYYLYYLYANLYQLNKMRESRGFNTIDLRPHSGEAGDPDHLACSFICARHISHGINLRKAPALQYLYYLAQIGLAMSPLSNNGLFLDYDRNPFPVFFARGLKVALSTDDPLMFHYTKEPLIEEYSVAQSVYKLNTCDICEVALNSVLQSGFEHPVKAYWLGEKYHLSGPRGNDITKTNVPNIRLCFRESNLREEFHFLERCLISNKDKVEWEMVKEVFAHFAPPPPPAE